jgi:hypothetical protein
VFGDCDCLLAFIFTALESNVDGFDEGVNFEDFEEDQGQAKQAKPPLLVAYLDPMFYLCKFFFLCLFKDALFCNCYYLLIAIRWRLGSTSHFLSSSRWHPLMRTYSIT